jgi:FtsZ-binding cell division protein ZapB
MQQSTQVLSEALTRLINAYEQLQKENAKLNDKIQELENDKVAMQQTIDELSNTTTKQTEDITSMLGKIESLLSIEDTFMSNTSMVSTKESYSVKTTYETTSLLQEEFDIIEENEESEEQKEEEISTSKIDLQRMEDLLSGFGNNR